MPASLHVQSGALIAHRLLDVANDIDLAQAEALWLSREGHESRRTRLSTAASDELAFDVPPALLTLPPTELAVDGELMQAEMSVRVYDFGALVIALRVPVSGLSWNEFSQRFDALGRATTREAAVWHDALRHVLDII